MARIGIVHPSLGFGGAERLIVDATLELRGGGHEVRIFTPRFDRRTCFPELATGEIPVEVHGAAVPVRFGPGFMAPLAIAATAIAARAAVQWRPDVIICDLVPHVIPLLHGNGTRIIYYCHHPDAPLTPVTTAWRRMYRLPIDESERRGIVLAHRILVNSAFTAEALGRFLGDRSYVAPEVVHPGVPVEPYARVPPLPDEHDGDEITIASINRFHDGKNLELAIHAFVALRGTLPEAIARRLRLEIAGGFDATNPHATAGWAGVVAARAGSGLGDHIRLRRNIGEAERLALLTRCRAVVYTASHEHFGYGVAEGMAAGRPVIACRSGGPTEIIRDGENGYLCEPSPEAFAAALGRIIEAPAQAAQLGRRARRDVTRRFSRAVLGERLRAVIDEETGNVAGRGSAGSASGPADGVGGATHGASGVAARSSRGATAAALDMAAVPVVSSVVTTTRPWPEVAEALRSLYRQTLAHGGEVILADGTGKALPKTHEFPEIRHLVYPAANVFHLRSAGLRAARAPVVALTEDHCQVAPDWIAAVLRAHAEFPEAGVIGGAVRNGAGERLVDWANFLASNGTCLPPVAVREGPDVTGQANVSYKRPVLTRYPDDALDEGRFRRELATEGVRLVADDRIVVDHVQSLGVVETMLIHFHDGRCVAAAHQARSNRMGRALAVAKGLLWPARVPAATVRVLARTLRDRPGYRRVALASAPWLLGVVAFHKAGEMVGALAGPGASPDRMR